MNWPLWVACWRHCYWRNMSGAVAPPNCRSRNDSAAQFCTGRATVRHRQHNHFGRVAKRHPSNRIFASATTGSPHDDRAGQLGVGLGVKLHRATADRDACRPCHSGTQRRPATRGPEQGTRCRGRCNSGSPVAPVVRGMTVPGGGQLLDQSRRNSKKRYCITAQD